MVKIRLQQQRGLAKDQLKYKGPIHCAATTIREEGIRGMWSGASPTVGRNGTNQMCLFWAKPTVDSLFWGKHDGDGKQLTTVQVCAMCLQLTPLPAQAELGIGVREHRRLQHVSTLLDVERLMLLVYV